MQQTVYSVVLNSFNPLKKEFLLYVCLILRVKLLILSKLCNCVYHLIVSLNSMRNRTFPVMSKHCLSCEKVTEGVDIIYNAYIYNVDIKSDITHIFCEMTAHPEVKFLSEIELSFRTKR